ncbi:MAG: CbiX/SirB N-terminal domain-containing protein [Clostridia bacterium]|nr:CbiX/SirB N-terminal domain-containing protein [Clostridia bacterium]
MKGIIIIAHGSRKPETKTVFKQVMAYFEQELAKGKIPVSAVAYCFLEFAEPNLKQALHDFVQKGIDDIKVIPYFLFEGTHTLEDIPAIIEEFCKEQPHIKVGFGRVLGYDERIVQILTDRVKQML